MTRPDGAAPDREEAAVSVRIAPAAAPVLVARILADRLNVRSDPTTDASVVGKLFVGNEVTVLDRADDGAWIRCRSTAWTRPPGFRPRLPRSSR
ncbi:MAG: SH3 domain-containing protein [Caldilineaceae bacterium]